MAVVDDPIVKLHEHCRRAGFDWPAFEDLGSEGPDHRPTFSARVSFGPGHDPRRCVHVSTGPSKKAAKRGAALEAWEGCRGAEELKPDEGAEPSSATGGTRRGDGPEGCGGAKKRKQGADGEPAPATERARRADGPAPKRGKHAAAAAQPARGFLQLALSIGGGGSTAEVHYARSGVDDVDGLLCALGLTSCAALGFDIEVRPAFRQGVRYPTAVVQLSSLTHCAVVSVGGASPALPASLRHIVEDGSVLKIGCGVKADLERLGVDFGGPLEGSAAAAGFLELSLLARLTGSAGAPGETDYGLRRLCDAVLGLQLSKAKALVLSRWDDVPLSAAQVRYAAMDATVAAHLAARMLGVDGRGVGADRGCRGEAERQIARRAAPFANCGPGLDDFLVAGAAHVARLPQSVRARIEQELSARKAQRAKASAARGARRAAQKPGGSASRRTLVAVAVRLSQ